MTNRYLNTLLVMLLTLIVAGAGYYQIEVKQPGELQRIEDEKKLARLQQARLEELVAEEATSAEMAEETMRKWHARYKYIPEQLKTPDIIQYLESLSTSGFEQFKYELSSRGSTPDFSYYLFEVSGTAFYENLYRFIWQLENNRAFYQVTNLDVEHTIVFKMNEATEQKKRLDMVNFSMKLKVFFAGAKGLSAPEEALPEVPDVLLPARNLPHNSFYPLVRKDLPPNDQLLLDIEQATLLSIVGVQAMFRDKNGQHIVREGDAIYLGHIVKIDPLNATVRASLNKGGVVEEIEVKLEAEALYKQTQDENTRLVPSRNN